MSMSMMSMMNVLPVSKMTAISNQMFACFFILSASELVIQEFRRIRSFIYSFIHHLDMSDALCHTGLSSVAFL